MGRVDVALGAGEQALDRAQLVDQLAQAVAERVGAHLHQVPALIGQRGVEGRRRRVGHQQVRDLLEHLIDRRHVGPGRQAAGAVELDRVKPTVTAPRAAFRTGATLPGSLLPVRLTWTGGDPAGMTSAAERLQQALQQAGAAMYQQGETQPGPDAAGPTDGRADEDVVEGEFSEN